MVKTKIKKEIMMILGILIILSLINFVSASSLSLSLGSYDSEIYNQETVNIPVTITASNITGSADVTLTPKSGLSCSTCTLSYSFTGASSEQGTVTFTLTGTQTGTYNPPFNSISAVSGSTSATPLSSGSQITVIERPSWVKSFTASDSTPNSGDEVTLTLEITPSGTFEGVSADLSLTSGLSRVSGSDPRTIGTISGRSTYQWIITATSSGTASVALSATSPSESASENTETVTITIDTGDGDGGNGGGGGGGGGVSKWVKELKLNRSDLNLGQALKQLKAKYRATFNVSGIGHYVGILNITSTTVTIEVASTPQTATLAIGETKKFDVNADGYYDISVKLDKITGDSADMTLTLINEKMPAGATSSGAEGTGGTGGAATGAAEGGASGEKSMLWLWIVIGIIIIIAVIIIVIKIRSKKD